MDRDRIEGKVNKMKGKVREGIGKATGDTSENLKGKAEHIKGHVQEGYGKVKDELRASQKKGEERRTHEPGNEDEL